MSLCQYKNAFGKPGEGAHRFRIFNIAIVDTLLTILLAYIIYYLTGFSLYYVVPMTFLFGIILHRLFCVRTTVDKILFPNAEWSYFYNYFIEMTKTQKSKSKDFYNCTDKFYENSEYKKLFDKWVKCGKKMCGKEIEELTQYRRQNTP